MPSGAKKRKAAKRKKEQEEKEKAMGSIPDSPLCPTDDPPPSPPAPLQLQGNDRKDRTAHDDGKTPFATLSQVNEEEGEGVPRSECVAVDLATESSENEVKVQGMAAAAAEEGPPAPKDELGVEIVRSEKGEPCDAEGAKELVIHVEQSDVASKEVKREKASLAETPKEASAVTDPPPSHESEVKAVPLPEEDAVEEQPHASGGAGQGTGTAEMVPNTEVVHRARWWNCCGLLDVLARSER
ncbi:uncharacterized protein LOC103709308 [Phoenix dactylifera]|uniref:Uncharacterized protein LOC103709308 n=1 Tax=Phoenix dactylifera TaxID=42345 RepID=A0A8B8J5X1_PHODC|nr:uncharacterized protein LOC103709308 [Phoenix dactylifera]